MSGYAKRFAETKCMPFLIKDGQLLKKCTEIWEKISNIMKIGIDREPVCDNKYLKIKIRYGITNFHNKEIPPKITLNVLFINFIDWFCF